MVKEKRNSNIELLRLLLMFSIIMLHLFGAQVLVKPEGSLLYIELFGIGLTIMSVNAFIFISGYYGIKANLKSFIRLVTQVLFYSISILVVFFVIKHDVSIKEFKKLLFPFSSSAWWFMSGYIALYIFSPILNVAVEKLSQKKMKWIVLGLLYLNCISCFVFRNSVFGNEGYSFFTFLVIYCLGRYMYKYKVKLKHPFLIYFVSCIFIFIINLVSLDLHFHIYLPASNYTNPLVILSAVAIFYFFLRMKPSYSLFINKIAGFSLAIYLIHTHPLIYPKIRALSVIIKNQVDNIYLNLLCLFVLAIFIFVISLLIESVRSYLFRPIDNYIEKVIDEKMS